MGKLEKLQEQMARIQEQIKSEEAKLKAEATKKRKKMIKIIGAFTLDQAEENGGLGSLVTKMEQAGYLKKPGDRALFDLPKAPTPPTLSQPESVSDAE